MQEALKKRLSALESYLGVGDYDDEVHPYYSMGYNAAVKEEIAFLKIVLGEITSVQS